MRSLIAAMFVLPAVAAMAQQPAAPTVDKKVCRSIGSTGSRIPIRECHLQSEWKVIDAAQTSQAANLQRQLNDGVGGAAVSNSPIPR